jgi:hypothetical protein
LEGIHEEAWAVKHISITPPSFMKFCPVVPEICRGQVHGARKERRRIKIRIIIRNGAKTITTWLTKTEIFTLH